MVKKVGITLDKELWVKAKTECARSGRTLSGLIASLLKKFLNRDKEG